MRMQTSQANCGPTAAQNALLALGIQRSAEELEKLCRTSATDGTTPRNLVRGLESIEGIEPLKIQERRRDVAMLKLEFALRRGRPVLLVWNNGTHWTAAVGMIGFRYLIADSDDHELVVSMTALEVADKWIESGVHLGIVLEEKL